jgi:phosphoribosylformimino-5-aminoimidazole carboxamide ribotide isomerase
VIKLGSGNHAAALEALRAYPGGLQLGGGVNADNAAMFIDAGASAVIVTSFVFSDGEFHEGNLKKLLAEARSFFFIFRNRRLSTSA